MEDRYTLRGMLEEKKEDLAALLIRMDNCAKEMIYHLKLTDRAYLGAISAVSALMARMAEMNKERWDVGMRIRELEDKLKQS